VRVFYSNTPLQVPTARSIGTAGATWRPDRRGGEGEFGVKLKSWRGRPRTQVMMAAIFLRFCSRPLSRRIRSRKAGNGGLGTAPPNPCNPSRSE
jgi:hypothetical protein